MQVNIDVFLKQNNFSTMADGRWQFSREQCAQRTAHSFLWATFSGNSQRLPVEIVYFFRMVRPHNFYQISGVTYRKRAQLDFCYNGEGVPFYGYSCDT